MSCSFIVADNDVIEELKTSSENIKILIITRNYAITC
jgi:hypothetical protein